jgi:hypothetical protein
MRSRARKMKERKGEEGRVGEERRGEERRGEERRGKVSRFSPHDVGNPSPARQSKCNYKITFSKCCTC